MNMIYRSEKLYKHRWAYCSNSNIRRYFATVLSTKRESFGQWQHEKGQGGILMEGLPPYPPLRRGKMGKQPFLAFFFPQCAKLCPREIKMF